MNCPICSEQRWLDTVTCESHINILQIVLDHMCDEMPYELVKRAMLADGTELERIQYLQRHFTIKHHDNVWKALSIGDAKHALELAAADKPFRFYRLGSYIKIEEEQLNVQS